VAVTTMTALSVLRWRGRDMAYYCPGYCKQPKTDEFGVRRIS